ncbi:MAG: DUF4389 domain-containing protein [Actinobacteria bacterium]|nr:DUF4389 domain-containing protein [Actinomycetota bacterium]
MNDPVKLVVTDDLQRTRASVCFRIVLAIPHFVWLAIWGIAVFFVVIANGLITLIKGRSPDAVHQFLSEYVRYAVHVQAYVNLIADRYPGFSGHPGYPIDVRFAPSQQQNRWTVLFRLVLAIPALLVTAALIGGTRVRAQWTPGSLLATVAVLGWFSSLVRARMPRGMRDAGAYALAYVAQVLAYLFVLTDRYPNSDPLVAFDDLPLPEDHPISLEVDDDLRRSRLTVFFRALLAVPHLIWLALWGIAALLAAIVAWFAALLTARVPDGLHHFLAAYLRYQTHVTAYLFLIANPFPGFTGAAGSFPVELVVGPREAHNRWSVLFRALLALPALAIASAYGLLLATAALLGWFAALVLGRMPIGLRNAAALALRYSEQVNAYLLLVTPRYPYSGPTAAPQPSAAPSPYLPPDPHAAVTVGA